MVGWVALGFTYEAGGEVHFSFFFFLFHFLLCELYWSIASSFVLFGWFELVVTYIPKVDIVGYM